MAKETLRKGIVDLLKDEVLPSLNHNSLNLFFDFVTILADRAQDSEQVAFLCQLLPPLAEATDETMDAVAAVLDSAERDEKDDEESEEEEEDDESHAKNPTDVAEEEEEEDEGDVEEDIEVVDTQRKTPTKPRTPTIFPKLPTSRPPNVMAKEKKHVLPKPNKAHKVHKPSTSPAESGVVCLPAILAVGTKQHSEYKNVCKGKTREESAEFILETLKEGLVVTFDKDEKREYHLANVWIDKTLFERKDVTGMTGPFFAENAHPNITFQFLRNEPAFSGFGRIRSAVTREHHVALKVTMLKKEGPRFDPANHLELKLTL